MKKIFFATLIAAAMSVIIIIPSCKKDDEDNTPKFTRKDSAEVRNLFQTSPYIIINEIIPRNGESNIHIGSDFYVNLGVAIGSPFEVKLAEQINTYRYDIVSCTLTDPSGANLVTEYKYNEQDTLIKISNGLLNANTEYTIAAKISLSQLIDGEWQPVIFNGAPLEYGDESKFTTVQTADVIRPDDILYSYPIDRQLNYMPKEYTEGYLMLNYKYPELFNGVAANDMKVVIKNITDATKGEQTTTFIVKESHEVDGEVVELNYSLKDIIFDSNQIYSLEFYCGNKNIHQIYFRTSFYETLKSKLAHHSEQFDGQFRSITIKDHTWGKLTKYLQLEETFDKYECQTISNSICIGTNETNDHMETLNTCLIPIEFDLKNCDWYQNSVFQLLYNNYPPFDSYSTQRGSSSINYPPNNACELFCTGITEYFLSDDEIQEKKINDRTKSYKLRSYLYDFMWDDICDRKSNIDYKAEKTDIAQQIRQFYWDNHQSPNPNGVYSYYISFRLPGKNTITYQERHAFTW
ncbi:MAG: hypothetical protein J6Z01_10045 [Bacteroidales bacterium]|nr:hypothetical protein [Bacteroidales bacterium]